MADELTRAEQWLYATLTADATLTGLVGTRVYSEVAPPEATYPCVIFGLQYAADVATHSAERIMVNGLWLVRGVVQASSFGGNLQTIADRLDALLHRSAGGTADAATVFTSVREEPFKQATVNEGIQYRSLGGLFRLYTQR